MLHALSLIMLTVVASAAPYQDLRDDRAPSPDPDYLDAIRVVEVRPSAGELTFTDPDGELRTLHEGDYLDEVDGARVKTISRTSLVLTRVVRGGDGQEGEALVVVRFDLSGKTKVREYRTVPDVSSRPTRHPNDR